MSMYKEICGKFSLFYLRFNTEMIWINWKQFIFVCRKMNWIKENWVYCQRVFLQLKIYYLTRLSLLPLQVSVRHLQLEWEEDASIFDVFFDIHLILNRNISGGLVLWSHIWAGQRLPLSGGRSSFYTCFTTEMEQPGALSPITVLLFKVSLLSVDLQSY